MNSNNNLNSSCYHFKMLTCNNIRIRILQISQLKKTWHGDEKTWLEVGRELWAVGEQEVNINLGNP